MKKSIVLIHQKPQILDNEKIHRVKKSKNKLDKLFDNIYNLQLSCKSKPVMKTQ